MALINLPIIVLLGRPACLCLRDYMKQKDAGVISPVFKIANIDLDHATDFWK
jgi:AGCS family alanine or glycine:cation symporter